MTKHNENIVREVLDTLYEAKGAILGVTALDTKLEMQIKIQQNECATTRRIDRAISAIQQLEEGNPWHKVSEKLPPVDTEVVCKMKGVPHTEHFICKWDGKFWWHWNYYDKYTQGWFGLNRGWEIVEWKEI